MAFSSADCEITIFQALLGVRRIHGGKKVILREPDGTAFTYDRLILASLILGRKLAALTPSRAPVALLLPNVAGLVAALLGLNAFGRPVRTDVTVTDWPLAELDRFKLKRPGLYAQMVTRLMTVAPTGPAPPSTGDCARLEALKREGKVQTVPAACGT